MFVALSRFTIANDTVDDVRDAFRHRPHLADAAPGFLGMDVMSPLDNRAEADVCHLECDGPSANACDEAVVECLHPD